MFRRTVKQIRQSFEGSIIGHPHALGHARLLVLTIRVPLRFAPVPHTGDQDLLKVGYTLDKVGVRVTDAHLSKPAMEGEVPGHHRRPL